MKKNLNDVRGSKIAGDEALGTVCTRIKHQQWQLGSKHPPYKNLNVAASLRLACPPYPPMVEKVGVKLFLDKNDR